MILQEIKYSNQIYGYERGATVYSGHSTTWTGKVALAYPSDYGYAADFNSCSETLYGYGYNNKTCTSNNWMKTIITNSGDYYGRLLTPDSGSSDVAWVVDASGFVFSNVVNYLVSYPYQVTPVLYLSSDETIVEGTTGSKENPYKLNP